MRLVSRRTPRIAYPASSRLVPHRVFCAASTIWRTRCSRSANPPVVPVVGAARCRSAML